MLLSTNALPLAKQRLAKIGYDRFSKAEDALLNAFVGQMSMTSFEDGVETQHSPDGVRWGSEREVRAHLIRALCADKSLYVFADIQGLWLKSAKVTGALDLSMAVVPFPIRLLNCFFEEALNLSQAEIPTISLDDSSAPGLLAELIRVKGNISLNKFICRNSNAHLGLARVSGNIDCTGASFNNRVENKGSGENLDSNGPALVVDGAIIDGHLLLGSTENHPFRSEGLVSLVGTQIGIDLYCAGAQLNQGSLTHEIALDAQRIKTKGSIYLSDNFACLGEARFDDAQIGGSFIADGGRFVNTRSLSKLESDFLALSLERATVSGTIRLSNSLSVEKVSVPCRVVGRLSLVDLRCGGVMVTDGADFRSATCDFSGASSSGLSDDGDKNWPLKGHLHLKRFIYGAIVGGTEKAEDRLDWLELQPESDFNTESYAQLASVLLQSGDDEGSRKVLKKLAELQDRQAHKFWFLSPMHWFQASIGDGYYPIWALWYVSLIGLIGWIIYRRAYLAGTFVPTDKDAYTTYVGTGQLPPYYPRLSSFMLSVENSLPLVKLGQADKWQPNPDGPRSVLPRPIASDLAHVVQKPRKYSRVHLFDPLRRAAVKAGLMPDCTGGSVDGSWSRSGTSPKFVRRFLWLQILLGWLFATLFVAGVTGLVKK